MKTKYNNKTLDNFFSLHQIRDKLKYTSDYDFSLEFPFLVVIWSMYNIYGLFSLVYLIFQLNEIKTFLLAIYI